MKSLIITTLFLLISSHLFTATARGVYVYADFGTTADSKAKIREYEKVRKHGSGYIFQRRGMREQNIEKVNFRGAIRYPNWTTADPIEKLTDHYTRLQKFKNKFPQSGKYLNNKILLLKQAIELKKNGPKIIKGKNYLGDFTTKDGKTYKNVKLIEKKLDSIEVIHAYGAKSLNHAILPNKIIAKVGGFDLEKIRVSKLSTKELAQEEHDKLLERELKEISKIKTKMNAVTKLSPPSEYKHLSLIKGTVLNKLPNGLLVTNGTTVVAVVEPDRIVQVNGKYSRKLVKTEKTYTYPTIKGEDNTVPVYKQPSLACNQYERDLKQYKQVINEYKSRILVIEKQAATRLENLKNIQR